MKISAGLAIGLCLAGAGGCVGDEGDDDKPDQSDVKGGADGKAEAWGSSDNPALFNTNLEYRVTELPRTGQARNVPWAGNYWPVYEDSINKKWAGGTSEAPSTKYGRAFGVTGVEDAVSKNHGVDNNLSRTSCTTDSQCNAAATEKCAKREGQTTGRCIPTWWGICHAWAPVAILLPEPKQPVTYNGVDFKVQDIKALLTLVHDRTETRFVSLRCDATASENQITFDKYGRPNGGASTNCRDTNPGTFHVLMTNYLGKQGESFVYDRTWDSEVWNQPLRGYRITAMDEISPLEANKAVGVTAEGGTTTEKTGTVAGGAWTQLGSFPVTAGSTLTIAMTGSGDPDMFVKFGAAPTESAYDCRPYETGPAETCTLTVPAGATAAFVAVNGYGTTPSTFNLKINAGGSIPTSYVFNANAVKLYKTHMDVDFIAESAAGTDGHLGSTIDTYTHHDRYDYILEVDGAGKIIGGEWIGTSKRQHPDFVWLPIRASASTVAGGKISYANVKMIYDLSMAGQGGGGGTSTPRTVNEAGTVAQSIWKQYGPFNVAAGSTFTATMTGDGDADLYVRKDAAPTAGAYDCRPYRDGTSEQCSIVGPAKLYVGVNGYATSSTYALKITYAEGTGGGGGVTPPPTVVNHVNTTGTVTLGELKIFTVDVIAGRKVLIRTTSTKDVDLYIQMGAAPTTAAYLMRGYTSSGNETIAYTPTSNGKLYVGVHGYEAGAFSVRTADQ
ncbi:MAG: pre-peptidase C-terminal domain-containing protein [Deltaproteobacteria bacterium]|nr:pre-peptidase C-terminal domain-containing protein [Deltaproteobacteria bacterium]